MTVHHLDGGDLSCARLLVLLRKRTLEPDVRPGDEVHLSTIDPVAVIDLPAWCHMTGNEYAGRLRDGSPALYAVRLTVDGIAGACGATRMA